MTEPKTAMTDSAEVEVRYVLAEEGSVKRAVTR